MEWPPRHSRLDASPAPGLVSVLPPAATGKPVLTPVRDQWPSAMRHRFPLRFPRTLQGATIESESSGLASSQCAKLRMLMSRPRTVICSSIRAHLPVARLMAKRPNQMAAKSACLHRQMRLPELPNRWRACHSASRARHCMQVPRPGPYRRRSAHFYLVFIQSLCRPASRSACHRPDLQGCRHRTYFLRMALAVLRGIVTTSLSHQARSSYSSIQAELLCDCRDQLPVRWCCSCRNPYISARIYSCEAKPSRCNRLVNRLNMETNRVTVAMM